MYKMPEVTNFKKKDNTYCCVPLCNSRGSKNPDLSFHLFPSEKKELVRRRKWILALRIGRPVSPRMSVCSRHFVHSDYVLPPHYERKRPRLRKHAIPSLNLPAPGGCEGKPEKRPTTIIIKKEPSSEAEEDRLEENAEEEELEIEVNIKSERNYFGTDFNSDCEPDYFDIDGNIYSERDYFETGDNIGSHRDDIVIPDMIDCELELNTEYNIESERDYLDTEDIESERDYLDTEDNTEFERDYLDTEDNTEFERDYLDTEDNIESERDYIAIQDYLEIVSNVEPEEEDLKVGNNIKSMTLMTLSKILI